MATMYFRSRRARGGVSVLNCTATAVMALALAGTVGNAQAESKHSPASIFVHSALGGQIFGYDVDQNGNSGILSEDVTHGFRNTIAIESFDLATGKVTIVKKIGHTYDNFVTLGVVGTSIGLVDEFRERKLFHRLPDGFKVLNPLEGNRITGKWTPSLKRLELIEGISETQGSSTTAVLAYKDDIQSQDRSFVFATDIATNTSGPRIQLKDPIFGGLGSPVIALDTATNQAIVAAAEYGSPAKLAVVDLTHSTVSEFSGLGYNAVNGIAVDSADGIAVTTTADTNVEYYNIANQTGTMETIKGATNRLQAGGDVQFDAVNGLFLILQPICSEGPGSCVDVYDTKGNWIKAVANLAVVGVGNSGHIAFNPTLRTGFVQSAANTLQSFSY